MTCGGYGLVIYLYTCSLIKLPMHARVKTVSEHLVDMQTIIINDTDAQKECNILVTLCRTKKKL